MLSTHKTRPFLTFCILISLAKGQALAASFDCSSAESPREQLICKDKNLSDLDKKLAETYQDRKSRLTKRGVEMLKNSERNWLHYSATVCPLSVPADMRISLIAPGGVSAFERDLVVQLTGIGAKQTVRS